MDWKAALRPFDTLKAQGPCLMSQVLKSRVKKNAMQKTNPEISELKQQIEESLGRKMKTSADFTFLSGAIWERTHENLSASTLKRIWGYVDGPDKTRNSTLIILSKFLGFKDWDGFMEHIGQDNGSDQVKNLHIKTDDLTVGDLVSVSWKPNRHCIFRYLGDYRFIVEQTENSKLKVGNTFRFEFSVCSTMKR